MRIIRLFVTVWFFVICMGLALTSVKSSFGESGLQKYESDGLAFRYSSDLMLMSSSSAEKIRNMLKDNYAQYDRNKSRGVPRPGSALIHGIVYCGECGHKMVVQYKNSTRYICNFLRQQHGSPVCQYIPADQVDQKVVEAFWST